jgi:hypothetical protein
LFSGSQVADLSGRLQARWPVGLEINVLSQVSVDGMATDVDAAKTAPVPLLVVVASDDSVVICCCYKSVGNHSHCLWGIHGSYRLKMGIAHLGVCVGLNSLSMTG